MRGRPPTPKCVPKVTSECPKPPVFLDVYALEEWQRVAPLLHRKGLLEEADVAALAGYCQSYALWRMATECVRADGLIRGTRANPMIKVGDDALKQIHRYVQLFGMSPSARSRMDIATENGEADELQAFLNEEAT